MSSKVDITDIRGILANVKSGRLKEALDSAKRCAVSSGMWRSLDNLSAHERTYRAMTEYMDSESDKEQRHRALARIKEDLLRLADAIRLDMDVQSPRPGRESDMYAAAVRTRKMRTGITIPQLSANIALSTDPSERFAFLDDIFTLVLTTQHLSPTETDTLRSMLDDTATDPDTAAMVLAALGLANLYYYDRAKLLLLMRMPEGENPELEARRWVGIFLALWRHPARIAIDPEIGLRMNALLDGENGIMAMRKVAMAVLFSRDTKRINEKMQNDIIPELQRLHSDLVKRFPSQSDMMEILDPEKNPEWEKILGKSSIGDSLQQLGDMQAQGGDVMMFAFSNLKNFNFFHRPGNWLIPFTPAHPALSNVAHDNGRMLEVIDSAADFLCDADKYSLALAAARMPKGTGAMMLGQLQQQFEQYREEKATTLSLDTEPALYRHITLYVRSLSRLVSQFPHSGLRIPDPFARAILPSTLPFAGNSLSGKKDLEEVAEFLFSRGYYDEVMPVLRDLEKLEPDSVPLLEKEGYALQQTGDPAAALKYYRRAESMTPVPGKWLLRKLASLCRAMGEYDEAVRYWRMLAEDNPDDDRTAMQLANSLFDAGNLEDALKYYYKVDYLRGSSPRTWRPIAWCEFMTGNYDKAQTYYDQLLAVGNDPSDLLNAGHLALAKGKLSNATELYSRAVEHSEGGLPAVLLQLESDAAILEAHGLDNEARALLADRLAYYRDQ